MSPLYDPEKYDPDANEHSPKPEGTYPFEIKKSEMKKYDKKDGGKGECLSIEFAVGDGKTFKSFDSFWFSDKALWRFKELMECLGLDFNHAPEPQDLVGYKGTADFTLGAPNDKGNRYLEPLKYIDKGGEKKKVQAFNAPDNVDEIPF